MTLKWTDSLDIAIQLDEKLRLSVNFSVMSDAPKHDLLYI